MFHDRVSIPRRFVREASVPAIGRSDRNASERKRPIVTRCCQGLVAVRLVRRLDRVNEWQLQKALTEHWLADGVDVDGRHQFLVAWEVMVPSWRINDARRHWSEPSIDFLTADATGVLTAIELKVAVPGVKPAWRVLCQVTHRAILLRRTFTVEGLNRAYINSHSGRHGRVVDSDGVPLVGAHQRFFGLSQPVSLQPAGLRRVVAAASFGRSFGRVIGRFNELSAAQVSEELEERNLLRNGSVNRESLRLVDAAPNDGELRPPVTQMTVERP